MANRDAAIEVSAFNGAPDFARGLVRDIRIRWACEEIDRPYNARLIDGAAPRPPAYFKFQPFGQVPAFWDGETQMFESGAIVLHLAEGDERLLPRDPVRRARATSWLFAALNTVEPPLTFLAVTDFFAAGEEWAKLGHPFLEGFARTRLQSLAASLGDKEWLEDQFTAADLMMISVLRSVRHTRLVEEHPNLAAYRARGEARPAFVRALDAQIADYGREAYAW
jgi:glutathione S-transferase